MMNSTLLNNVPRDFSETYIPWTETEPQRPYITATVAVYLLLASFIISVPSSRLLFQRLNPKKHNQVSIHRPALWYNHTDPFLGLDILWKCAWAVAHSSLLETTRNLIVPFGRTVSYLVLGKQAVFTIDPANLKVMLSGQFGDYSLGSTRKTSLKALFGNGIFNSDGEVWRAHRNILRPFLPRVRSTELDIFEEQVQHLLRCIPQDSQTIDLQPLFSSLTLDITTSVFLGESTNLLKAEAIKDTAEGGHTEGQEFAEAFEYAQQSLIGVNDYGLWRKFQKLFCGDRKLEESLHCLGRFVDKVLDRSMQVSSSSSSNSSTSSTNHFLGAMVSSGRSKADLRLDVLNVVLAGKDTTASFLGSLWYVLSQRPDIVEKLRDEIGVLNGQRPTKEHLQQFSYLHKVLQETLRLFPPIAVNQRTAEVDTILPHGGGADGQSPMRVPRGASVGYSVYAMHRIPEFFGPDVDTFRPERWADIRPKWAFMPFHAGPRICLGQQLAMALAKYSTVRLLQYFGGVEDRNEVLWEEKIGISCSSKHGVRVSLTARK